MAAIASGRFAFVSRPDAPFRAASSPTATAVFANEALPAGVSTALGFALAGPPLLAYNLPPSSTLLNQIASLVGWGIVALLCGLTLTGVPRPGPRRDVWPLAAGLGLLLMAAVVTPAWTGQPLSLAAGNVGLLVAALVVFLTAVSAATRGHARALWTGLWQGLLLAATLSAAVGAVQVFAPSFADGDWIARSGFPGRAVGNLRQPNHLSTLLLWGVIALVALGEGRRLTARTVVVGTLGLLLAIVLTASRTGVVGVLLLAVWGALDRSLARRTRGLLLATPVLYGLGWLAFTSWAHATGHVFGGEQRFTADGDLSSSRFAIWSNTLSLIATHPLAGVGFGEFNFVWTLTPFPNRPVAFFDHTHNLVLQFAVEFGLPLAALLLALLLQACWRVARRAHAAAGEEALHRRAGLMLLAVVALHSQLEYPLWYAYFLLPTAWAFGLSLGGRMDRSAGSEAPSSSAPAAAMAAGVGTPGVGAKPSAAIAAAGAVLALGGAAAGVDYLSAVSIYTAGVGAPPLAERIAAGQRSLFFAHQGDYAAATTSPPADALPAADRAAHFLLDARLMQTWAEALAANGDLERARHVAARLREFRNEQAAPFFEACERWRPEGTPPPFQCTPPAQRLDERAFR